MIQWFGTLIVTSAIISAFVLNYRIVSKIKPRTIILCLVVLQMVGFAILSIWSIFGSMKEYIWFRDSRILSTTLQMFIRAWAVVMTIINALMLWMLLAKRTYPAIYQMFQALNLSPILIIGYILYSWYNLTKGDYKDYNWWFSRSQYEGISQIGIDTEEKIQDKMEVKVDRSLVNFYGDVSFPRYIQVPSNYSREEIVRQFKTKFGLVEQEFRPINDEDDNFSRYIQAYDDPNEKWAYILKIDRPEKMPKITNDDPEVEIVFASDIDELGVQQEKSNLQVSLNATLSFYANNLPLLKDFRNAYELTKKKAFRGWSARLYSTSQIFAYQIYEPEDPKQNEKMKNLLPDIDKEGQKTGVLTKIQFNAEGAVTLL